MFQLSLITNYFTLLHYLLLNFASFSHNYVISEKLLIIGLFSNFQLIIIMIFLKKLIINGLFLHFLLHFHLLSSLCCLHHKHYYYCSTINHTYNKNVQWCRCNLILNRKIEFFLMNCLLFPVKWEQH